MRPNSVLSLLLAGFVACGGAKSPASIAPEISETPYLQTVKEYVNDAGQSVVEVDLNKDGNADILTYYHTANMLEGSTPPMARKEVDLNRDGRVDVVSHYDTTGVVTKEEMDGDFDGRWDWVDHFVSGKRVKSEVDSNYDGRIDLYRYYENEIKVRRERDTDTNGLIDHWEFFDPEGEEIIMTGYDTDGDGKMDVREE